MKLRYLGPAVLLALTTVAAHAQVGIYLNPIAIRASNSTLDSSSFAFLGQNSSSQVFYGANLGIYYDFFHASNGITVGGDMRQSDLHANNATLKEFLVGVRISGQPFTHPFRPYIQASVGIGATKAPSSVVSVKKPEFRFYGGIDYAVHKHIDLRAIEIGYGTLTTISSATVGSGGNVAIPATTMLSFSSGLVFRF